MYTVNRAYLTSLDPKEISPASKLWITWPIKVPLRTWWMLFGPPFCCSEGGGIQCLKVKTILLVTDFLSGVPKWTEAPKTLFFFPIVHALKVLEGGYKAELSSLYTIPKKSWNVCLLCREETFKLTTMDLKWITTLPLGTY